MLLEEDGVGLRGWRTVSVAALGTPFSGAPNLLQNSLSCGGTAEHDGQSLNQLSFRSRIFKDCFALAHRTDSPMHRGAANHGRSRLLRRLLPSRRFVVVAKAG
jgi:hypothetical protein